MKIETHHETFRRGVRDAFWRNGHAHIQFTEKFTIEYGSACVGRICTRTTMRNVGDNMGVTAAHAAYFLMVYRCGGAKAVSKKEGTRERRWHCERLRA